MLQKTPTKIIIYLSFLLSALLGAYLLYFTLFKDSPKHGGTLSVSSTNALAQGDMAAFLFNNPPKELPELKFLNPDLTEISLADFKGKTILLNVWATWCAPCRAEMPTLDDLQAKLGSDKFEVVTISVDRKEPEVPQAFFDEISIKNLKLYTNPTASAMRTLRARGLPLTMLINAEGKEVGRLMGAAEWDSPDAIKLISEYLEKP